MKTSINKLRENAISLSSSGRASLIHDLILSLEEKSSFDLSSKTEKALQA
jgi:hypothetical protein